jgi:hypothetical protein
MAGGPSEEEAQQQSGKGIYLLVEGADPPKPLKHENWEERAANNQSAATGIWMTWLALVF